MKRVIGLIGMLVIMLGNVGQATPALDKKEAFEKCKQWLVNETSYKAFVEAERIHEYVDRGEYNLRANVVVQTIFDDVATIGFNCEVYLDDSRVVAYTDTEVFELEEKESSKVQELKARRIRHGASGCPSVNHWKTFAKAVDSGDYSVDLSPECVWLEKGTKVFGPVQRVPDPTNDFLQIKLSDGKKLWVEEGAF